jgi:uncharacterized DUF497 family protein
MKFEFDNIKSDGNRKKHGIDFPGAQAIWSDPDRLEIPARTEGEARWMVIGKIGILVWSVVMTYRGENVRLISARPASRKEVELYEGEDV